MNLSDGIQTGSAQDVEDSEQDVNCAGRANDTLCPLSPDFPPHLSRCALDFPPFSVLQARLCPPTFPRANHRPYIHAQPSSERLRWQMPGRQLVFLDAPRNA